MKLYFFDLEVLSMVWIFWSGVFLLDQEKRKGSYQVWKRNVEWIRSTISLFLCGIIFSLLLFLLYVKVEGEYESFLVGYSSTLFYRYLVSIFFLSFLGFFFPKESLSLEYWINSLILLLTSLIFLTLENIFLIFLLLEIQTFIVYFLIVDHSTRSSIRGAVQLFFQNVLVTFVFMVGLYLFYGTFESYQITEIETPWLLWLFFFKLGLFPFHLWVLNILKTTNYFLAFLLGIFLKWNYFYFILQFSSYGSSLFLWMGFLSLLFGGIGGLFQMNWISIFVFSMVVNVGNLTMIYSFGEEISFIFGIYFQVIYLVVSVFFLLFLKEVKESVKDSKNLYLCNPWEGITYTILFFSLMGIPPFVGFFLKVPLISLIFSKQIFFLSSLFLFANLLNIFLYLRGVKYLVFGDYESKFWSQLTYKSKETKEGKVWIGLNGIQGGMMIFYPVCVVGVIEIFL